jgi:hypothetical protein
VSLMSWIGTPFLLMIETAGVHPAQIMDAVPGRIQMMLDWIPRGAAAGDAGLYRLMSQGEPERSQTAPDEPVPRLGRIRRLLD